MRTEELIGLLTRDVRKVPRFAVGGRLGAGISLGVIGSVALMMLVLGLRPGLTHALGDFSFWMKSLYTASLAFGAIYLTGRFARPERRALPNVWIVAAPVIALSSIAIAELLAAPQSEWLAMWLGKSWKVCSSLVFTLSIPIFIGLVWSFRRFAPTQLRAAGAAAGLAAGASAATVYCLHCPEVSALFVLTWYTLGILLAGLAGALLGPRLLRW